MIEKLRKIGSAIGTVIGLAYIAGAIVFLLWLPERIPAYGYQEGTDNLVDRAGPAPAQGHLVDRPVSLSDREEGQEGSARRPRQMGGPRQAPGPKTQADVRGPRPAGRPYGLAVAEIHRRESRCGRDPKSRRGIVGKAGERGEFQVTPIWQRDCRRLFGVWPDPYDLDQVRRLIPAWLAHYAPRVGAVTVDDMCELYRRGPTGYRKWQRRRDR